MGEAEEHLSKVCKRFARVVPNHEPYPTTFEKKKDPYRSLVRSVVYQQLSGKAAGTIHGRMIALFPDKDHPDPEDLIEASPELLRSAGLSRQKIAAIKDVAQKRIDGVIPEARKLSRMPNEEIIERLTAARGVGRWTVEMYLMFTLGRPDVLPIDDLGVRKGAKNSTAASSPQRPWAPTANAGRPCAAPPPGTCGACSTRRRRSRARFDSVILDRAAARAGIQGNKPRFTIPWIPGSWLRQAPG
ncbi:MAG: DNA-3-methyladenine glycosylase 2 family protein [Caulobacteraceae bacterium]|nr:DNA-3-methyladenine glycosylase 2 family protein [Caulobacteraceae bacterium]